MRWIEYGYDPEGRDKKWANSEDNSRLKIKGYNICFDPMVERNQFALDDQEQSQGQLQAPPTRQDIATVVARLDRVADNQKWLNNALVIAAIIIGWLIYSHH